MISKIHKLAFGILISILGLTACSQEYTDIVSSKTPIENLSFRVNISTTKLENTRAASDNKQNWSKGDQIFAAIDGDKNNICVIEYDGEDWAVNKLTNQVQFANKGKLNAIFADKLSYLDNKITTFGDIVFTKDGEYTKDGDIVYINLKLNTRPVSKIRINGIPEGFYVEGMREFTDLNISDMTWSETNSQGKLCSESEGDNNYTYYGIVSANNGNTTIKLINDKGSYFTKTFNSKTISAGDFIEFNGPLKSNGWDKKIFIESITAIKDIKLEVGGSADVTKYYSISPSNATETSCKYESSNSHIITVDDKGNMKAIARGEAIITVKSIDGKYSCEIKVNVKDITDFIKTSYIGGSIFSLNGLIQYGSQLSWQFINYSSKTVKFVSMQLVDGVTGKEGNEMSVNKDVPSNQDLAYNITIGLLGIHEPVSCRFKYEVDGKTYISTATYSSGF